MEEFLRSIFSQVDPTLAYGILLVSAFVENIFPPIPGDTVTVLGAYLITTEQLGFWGVYASTTIGSVIGFYTMFMIGRKFGPAFFDSRIGSRFFSSKHVDRVERWFDKYGVWVVAANRFLSGTRSVVSLFAGFFKMDGYTVLGLSLLSAAVWNGLLIYGGYQLGVNWKAITSILSQYNKIVIVLTLVLILFFIVRKMRKKSTS